MVLNFHGLMPLDLYQNVLDANIPLGNEIRANLLLLFKFSFWEPKSLEAALELTIAILWKTFDDREGNREGAASIL